MCGEKERAKENGGKQKINYENDVTDHAFHLSQHPMKAVTSSLLFVPDINDACF